MCVCCCSFKWKLKLIIQDLWKKNLRKSKKKKIYNLKNKNKNLLWNGKSVLSKSVSMWIFENYKRIKCDIVLKTIFFTLHIFVFIFIFIELKKWKFSKLPSLNTFIWLQHEVLLFFHSFCCVCVCLCVCMSVCFLLSYQWFSFNRERES